MKKRFTKYIALLAMVLGSACHQEEEPDTLPEAIDRIAAPYIALGGEVGFIIGTIQNGKRTTYSYGSKKLGGKEKITAQSVMELASLTKVYTSTALASMHLRGELDLDDPIENYLPARYHVPSFDGKKITLRHLANHTSGFPRYPDNIDKDAYNMYDGYTEPMMMEFINHFTLTRAPGTVQEYSNTGYGLLGYILSLKNNSDYETMITGRVLKPLGLTHTSVSFTEEQLQNLVQGYNGNKPVESWSKYQQNIFQGAGSLISTMDDQLLYLQANMGLIDTPLTTAMEIAQNYSENDPDALGLGWNKDIIGDLHIINKNGGNGCYTTFIGFDKRKQIGVVVMTNSSLNPDLFQTQMGFEILKVLNRF